MCFRGRSGALPAQHSGHSEEFLTLKTPLLSINAPFIFSSNSCQWEHKNGSLPFLNKSSDNSSPRTSLSSIPYRTSFVCLEGWHFPKLFPLRAHSSPNPQSTQLIRSSSITQGPLCIRHKAVDMKWADKTSPCPFEGQKASVLAK